MARRYRLDRKIRALDLLEEHDDDFELVKDLLDIPVTTLANWRRGELALRQRFFERQQQHFYNVKFGLLRAMLGSCESIMRRIDDDAINAASLLQRANTMSRLLNDAVRLEEAFEELEEKEQQEEAPNRARFIYNGGFHDAPPWAEEDPEPPGSIQSHRLREALGQIGVGADCDKDRRPPRTQALLVDRPDVSNGEPDLARLEEQRETPQRRCD